MINMTTNTLMMAFYHVNVQDDYVDMLYNIIISTVNVNVSLIKLSTHDTIYLTGRILNTCLCCDIHEVFFVIRNRNLNTNEIFVCNR